MTSSQSPETSLINGQLGTNEGSAFSTRHVHVCPYRGSRSREKSLPVIRSRSDVLPLIRNSDDRFHPCPFVPPHPTDPAR
jgi:hypothetical protein